MTSTLVSLEMLLSRCSISYSIQLIIAKKAATNRQVAIFRSAFALFITYSIRASRQKRKSFIEFYKKKRPSRQLERFLIDYPRAEAHYSVWLASARVSLSTIGKIK